MRTTCGLLVVALCADVGCRIPPGMSSSAVFVFTVRTLWACPQAEMGTQKLGIPLEAREGRKPHPWRVPLGMLPVRQVLAASPGAKGCTAGKGQCLPAERRARSGDGSTQGEEQRCQTEPRRVNQVGITRPD